MSFFNPNNPYKTSYNRRQYCRNSSQQIKDYGPYPFATDIENITKSNHTFRTALWTGPHLQVTLMSLLPGEEIGLEKHDNIDQFIRIEDGKGLVTMGNLKDTPNFQQVVSEDDAFVVPAGTWHNLINIGTKPLKLYSIYAPVKHPFGTVHETKADADAAESH